MNNWKEAKFSSSQSSFMNKKSFNSIINLNTKSEKTKPSFSFSKYITKDMKFYNKSFEELLKENMTKKFDSVTFTSIKHKKKSQEPK